MVCGVVCGVMCEWGGCEWGGVLVWVLDIKHFDAFY